MSTLNKKTKGFFLDKKVDKKFRDVVQEKKDRGEIAPSSSVSWALECAMTDYIKKQRAEWKKKDEQ